MKTARPACVAIGTGRRAAAPLVLALVAALLATGCALPRWPVAGTMTSPFGLRFRGWSPDLHHGVDIAAPEGTAVRALKGGRVRFAGRQGGYGNVIYLDHGSSTTSVYAHLAAIRVTAGQRVRLGDVIGTVGRTGNATGPHLHLEVWMHGQPQDPVPLLGGFPPAR